jgi:acetyl-CoA synthetase
VLFTGDGFYRRGSEIALKESGDEAIQQAGHVEHTIVYDRLGMDIPWDDDRDEWFEDAVATQDDTYETKSLPSDAESMLLYSSGTTGEPKGIVHTHAGGLVQPSKEVYFAMDHKDADRFFWVSDIGWMMGPWTLIGNHAFGGTVFMYEGAPDHPEPDRFWEMIDRHNLSMFAISPTAIRALREHGDEWVEGHDLSSLRILGSTGEPWDPESWLWFYERVGGGEAPIINISGPLAQTHHARRPRARDGRGHLQRPRRIHQAHRRAGVPGLQVLLPLDDEVALAGRRTVPRGVLEPVRGHLGPR